MFYRIIKRPVKKGQIPLNVVKTEIVKDSKDGKSKSRLKFSTSFISKRNIFR